MNKFIAYGVLGTDPTPINKGCSLNLAIRTKEKGQTLWMQVIVFNRTSELCLEYKKKGDKVFVDGHLEKNPNGEYVVIANDIGFM